MAPATPNTSLGIKLYKPSLGVDHQVGVRYWTLGEDGELGAPLRSGIPWEAGLNRGLTSGLYCFQHGEELDAYGYFTLSDSTYHGAPSDQHVIGGIAYWVPTSQVAVGGIVNAKYAAVACLTMPPYATDEHRARIERAAGRYGVEIVGHADLAAATHRYVESRLPNFYDPPLRPLHSLIGRTGATRATLDTRFDLVPRTHRARPEVYPLGAVSV